MEELKTRISCLELAVEEILYFTRIAAGAFSCWKCKNPMKNWDPIVYGSDGRFYHPECFDEKEMPK